MSFTLVLCIRDYVQQFMNQQFKIQSEVINLSPSGFVADKATCVSLSKGLGDQQKLILVIFLIYKNSLQLSKLNETRDQFH